MTWKWLEWYIVKGTYLRFESLLVLHAMSSSEPVVYLNGQFVSRCGAKLDIEDRGTMFADGVYVVLQYCGGWALAMDQHLYRLKRSMAEIRLSPSACIWPRQRRTC